MISPVVDGWEVAAGGEVSATKRLRVPAFPLPVLLLIAAIIPAALQAGERSMDYLHGI